MDYFDMIEDTSVPPFSSFKNIEYYLFGNSGFEKDLSSISDSNIHLIDLDTLFLKK